MQALTAKDTDQQRYKFVTKGGTVIRVKFHQLLGIQLITCLRYAQLVHTVHPELNTLAPLNIKTRLARTRASNVQLASNAT